MSGAWLDRSPSYAAGLSHGGVLASEQEWRIRAVLAGYGSGVAVDHAAAPVKKWSRPLPHTKCEHVGPGRRLTIEATIQL